jgi:hypothetical protein
MSYGLVASNGARQCMCDLGLPFLHAWFLALTCRRVFCIGFAGLGRHILLYRQRLVKSCR